MKLPTAAEIETLAEFHRNGRAWDARHAPNAKARKDLAKIEKMAHQLLEAFEAAGEGARAAIAREIGEILPADDGADPSIPTDRNGTAVLHEVVRLVRTVSAAAKIARAGMPQSAYNSAARMTAIQLQKLFLHHALPFSATADEFGGTSHAVATLLEIARMSGDADMTPDSARKWVEFAKRETVDPKTDDGLPIF